MQRGHDETIEGGQRDYPLGYSEHEFARLQRQGEFFRELTEDMLRRAGLAPGMRVLDIGCGVGDVSLVAGSLVGPSGAVLGVDRSPQAIGIAARRAAAARQPWVRFAQAELDSLHTREQYDALIGRLVLMYFRDPPATLREIVRCVRPGGIVTFQEMAMPLARCIPAAPQFCRCVDWILQTLERGGAELDMGGNLARTFRAAGLPAPQMIAGARVETGSDSPVYEYVAETLRSLLPLAESLGVATAADVRVDTLAERLREEAVRLGTSMMPPPLIAAWTRVST